MAEQKQSAGMGLVFIAAGIGMTAWMTLDQTGLNAPLFVAQAAGMCFATAGAAMLAGALGRNTLARVFGLLTIYALLVPGLWIGVFSGGMGCSVSVSARGVFLSGIDSLLCQIGFGGGAVLTALFAVFATVSTLRQMRAVRTEHSGVTEAGQF